MGDEYSLEVAGGLGDTPIREGLGRSELKCELSKSWHSVHQIGCAEGSCLSYEGRLICAS
jgi:hypothetical protein